MTEQLMDAQAFIMGISVPSAKFPEIGASVEGTIKPTRARPQRSRCNTDLGPQDRIRDRQRDSARSVQRPRSSAQNGRRPIVTSALR
jgi:hypothetical protein